MNDYVVSALYVTIKLAMAMTVPYFILYCQNNKYKSVVAAHHVAVNHTISDSIKSVHADGICATYAKL